MCVLSLAVFIAAPAHAQFTGLQDGSALTIALNPAYPAPGDQVQLTLRSPSYDLDRSYITWRANGTIIAEGEGAVAAKATAGALGSAVSIEATVENADISATAVARIIPASVDLIWESDSLVPPFYRGRALPSAGTSLRMQAIARFGNSVPDNQITYTWKRNGAVLSSLSGRGRSSITIGSPALFGSDIITVEASTAGGQLAGAASVRIASIEPELALYQRHPLFGVEYHKAIGAVAQIPQAEVTFHAVPYFADAARPTDPALEYGWQVNQRGVQEDPARSNEITIDASNAAGVALIRLALSHASNLFFSADGTWNVTFSPGARAGADLTNDPFRPTSAQ